MTTKKAIMIEKYGEAQVLKVNEYPFEAKLNDDEVEIDVHYSGINFADTIMRLGFYQDAPPRPFIPGYEIAGVIKNKGKNVTRFEIGEEVAAGTRFGGYTSKIILPSWQVIKKPKDFTLEETAAIPVNYLTAYIALNEIGRVREGDKVLVDCATGGVGVMALQIISKVNAHAVGLTSSESKKDFITKYGAKALTWDEFEADDNEKDFNIILNSTGGKTVLHHFNRMSKAGHLICFGASEGVMDGKRDFLRILKLVYNMPKFTLMKLIKNNKSVGGLNALYYFDDENWMRKRIPEIEKCEFRPHIDSVFKASEAAKAHKHIELRKAKGKVLLSWL